MSQTSDTSRDLVELVDRLERVEWREVPGVSSSTAAAFTAQVGEAIDGEGGPRE